MKALGEQWEIILLLHLAESSHFYQLMIYFFQSAECMEAGQMQIQLLSIQKQLPPPSPTNSTDKACPSDMGKTGKEVYKNPCYYTGTEEQMAYFASNSSPIRPGPSGLLPPETYCTRATGRRIRKVADENRCHEPAFL